MPQYASTEDKSDELGGTERYVCEDCEHGVTGHSIKDAVGNPTALYRCPVCGPRTRVELKRIGGGA
jgi:rubrerythrin